MISVRYFWLMSFAVEIHKKLYEIDNCNYRDHHACSKFIMTRPNLKIKIDLK